MNLQYFFSKCSDSVMRISKYVGLFSMVAGVGLSAITTSAFGFLVDESSRIQSNSVVSPASKTSLNTHPDTSLISGVLPNGLTYYIRANSYPKNRIDLRLAVNAGSVLEDDDQQGFAHFLEHMAFNGTKNFPGHELIDFVEGAGMSFGAHLNAYTTFDETVYRLTIPTDKRESLTKGLQVLKDWASGDILIDSSEVVLERGVVLGEWRSRLPDTMSERVRNHQISLLVGNNSPYLKRFPIGDPEILERANPAPLKRFYKDWYRPDLMAVIVVGDFDPKEMEKDIVKGFASINSSDNPRRRVPSAVSAEKVSEKDLAAKDSSVFESLLKLKRSRVDISKGRFNPEISIVWPKKYEQVSDDDYLTNNYIEDLFFQFVSKRFTEMRGLDRRPFFAASMQKIEIVRELRDLYVFSVIADPDSLVSGMSVALGEIEKVARYGIPPNELTFLKSRLLRILENRANSEASYPSQLYADQYVAHYLKGEGVLMSPGQAFENAKMVLQTITPESFKSYAEFWRNDTTKVVIVRVPEFSLARTMTEGWVRAAFDSVLIARITTDVDTAVQVKGSDGLLTILPQRGSVVSEKHFSQADIYEWKLSNGAKVIYKENNSNPEQLFIKAHSLGGSSLLPDSLAFSPGRLVGAMMTSAAGIGELDRKQFQGQYFNTILTEFNVAINYSDEEISIGGSPKELETIFQMLYLQFVSPKIDTSALKFWKAYGANTVATSTNDQIAYSLSRGNRRLIPPSLSNLPLFDVKQAMAVYKDRFGDAGDFTFTIVGAANKNMVKELVEQYIGSLPSTLTSEREVPLDPGTAPWDQVDRRKSVHPALHSKRAVTTFGFDGIFPTDPTEYLREQQKLYTIRKILSDRLRQQLREDMSITYGVSVSAQLYRNPKLHYQIMINMDAPPERIDTANIMIMRQLDRLRKDGANNEELGKALVAQQRSLETNLLDNRYWLSMIQSYDQLGISLDEIVAPYTRSVSSEEIKLAAQKYLPSSALIGRTFVPQGTKRH